jgi:hypothetical protein
LFEDNILKAFFFFEKELDDASCHKIHSCFYLFLKPLNIIISQSSKLLVF